jgi:hypothetical protein
MRASELREAIRLLPLRIGPWLRFQARKNAYRLLDEDELRATRRSDTVFVFGSGASLNDVEEDEWAHIEQHDTLGFNWWVHQRFVRADYHLIRGIPDTDLDPSVWRPQLAQYFGLIRSNPLFDETIFLVHSGFRAINGNRAIGLGHLPEGRRVFLWRTRIAFGSPSRSFAEGLVHGSSTLQEAINFSYLLGWKRIVLAGVDLYDRRYFWLPMGETRSVDERRDATAVDPHVQAATGLIATLGAWREWLLAEGVELEVYNPRSLLAGTLPVYRHGSARANALEAPRRHPGLPTRD